MSIEVSIPRDTYQKKLLPAYKTETGPIDLYLRYTVEEDKD